MNPVYCQIRPAGLTSPDYLVRLILPYAPGADAATVRSSWGAVEENIKRAIRQARHEDESMPLPGDLPPSLAVELTAPGWIVENPDLDLFRYLRRDLQRTIIAVLSDDQREQHGAPRIWTPS